MKKKLFAIIITTIIVSCNEKAPKKENSEKTEIAVQKNEQPEKSILETEKPFSEWGYMKVDVENFPVTEETSFDTYDESYRENHPDGRVYTKLKKEQIQKLGLQDWLKNGTDISVNYELPYSENFRTFVFTFQDGEMELKTFMVTFDKKFKKIDELQIAYDEIAESWMWTKSAISKNKIEVKDYNESSGETEITTIIYKLDENGKFVKLSKNEPKME